MKEIKAVDVKDNVIEQFDFKNALACARKDNSFNMCSIGWGSIGVLWSKQVMTIYVKPIRYTSLFLDNDDYFTVTFFNDDVNDRIIKICGTCSGKDTNKVEKANLKPIYLENGVSFEGYKRIYVCKKIYQDQFKKECFVNSKEIIKKYYDTEQCHNIYVGEIIKVYEQ